LQQTRRSRHAAPEPAEGEVDAEAEPGAPGSTGSHEKGVSAAEAQARTEAALRALAELSQPSSGPPAQAAPATRRPEVASGARPWLGLDPAPPATSATPLAEPASQPAAGRPTISDPYAQAGTPSRVGPGSGPLGQGPGGTGPAGTGTAATEPAGTGTAGAGTVAAGTGATGPDTDLDEADQDGEFEDRPEHPSGYARRNRIARGYSIPRLSRSKKPGAVPGT